MSKNIGELKGRIAMEASGFKEKMAEARAELDKTANSSKNLARDFDAIQKASFVVGGAVAAAIGGTVKIAADFEKQMSRVKAISGATDGEFKKLKESALELGAATSKSAGEVAVGMEDMAAMGFNVNEILAAMPGVISASEAAGSDLAATAGIVASALNAFQMEASGASKIADILAMTANVSAASVEDMGYAFKYAAPIASSLGVSIEELSASVGIMTNAGLEGSQAGTSLRAGLIALLKPAEKTSKMMDAMGITVENASGEFVGMSGLIDNLAEAMEGQTQVQKLATLAALVGTEAATGFLTLMEAGPEKIDEFTHSLENSAGASKEAADIMMDNLAGSVEEFTGGLETLGIKIGDEFLPLFKEIVDAGSEVIEWFIEADSQSIKLGLSFAGITAATAIVITTIGKLGMAFSAFAMTPVGAVITGLSLLAGLIGTIILSSDEMKEVNLEHANALIEEQQALEGSIKAYDDLRLKMKLSTDELARFVDINSLLLQTADPAIIESLTSEQEKLREKSGLTNDEFNEFLRLNDLLIETVPESNIQITEQGNALLGTTAAAKDLNKEKLRFIQIELEAQMATAEANQEKLLRDQEKAQKAINKANEEAIRLKKLENEVIRDIGKLERELEVALANGDSLEITRLQQKIEKGKDRIEGIKGGIAEQRNMIVEKETELQKINEGIGLLDDSRQKLAQIMLAQQGLNSEKGKEIEAIDTAILKLQNQRKQIQSTTPEAAKNTQEYREAISAIDGQISNLKTVRGQIVDITGQARDLNSELSRGITKTVNIQATGRTDLTRPQPIAYHSGGIAGDGRLPKMHSGNPVSKVMDQLKNIPMHNEIDVRLLRNEMVLTETQQANLFGMLNSPFGVNQSSGGYDDRVVSLLEIIAQGVQQGKDIKIVMDHREVGRAVEPYVSRVQTERLNKTRRGRF